MGEHDKKRHNKQRDKKLEQQNPAAREAAANPFELDDFDGPVPMTYQGRVITPEVIVQMRARSPEPADRLDAEWERMVLDDNQPWFTDQDPLHDTGNTWTHARTLSPDAFADHGSPPPAADAWQVPRPRQEMRSEGLDPVELLLRVEGMNSTDDFEATPPDQWHIDGRLLTKEELRALLSMGATDFLRYSLTQDEGRESGGSAQP